MARTSSTSITYRVGSFTDRHQTHWCGSVLETHGTEPYRVHVPWLSAEAEALRAALEAGDREQVGRLRHSSYRMHW